jgi:hypothetical protein
MTKKQKAGVKQAALELYRTRRISLKMAAWAMKNAGYTREETSKALELEKNSVEKSGITKEEKPDQPGECI